MPTKGPGFFVQHTEGDIAGRFVRDLASASPDWHVGTCVLLPRWFESTQRKFAVELEPHVDFFLADPETRKLELPYASRGRGKIDFDYLKESDPLVNRGRFVKQTLEAQVNNGRSVLISPWLIHGVSGTDKELAATLDFARRASESSLVRGRSLLIGLEATAAIFADRTSRDRFIDEVVEADLDLPVYLRMTIDPPESRKPYADKEPLVGLRTAVEAFSDNDLGVVLPQIGLAGWLMLPFGASTFGAGAPTVSMDRNVRPAANTGGGGAQPLNWYFCPDLLTPVLAEELRPLYRNGVAPCDCPYCSASPPRTGAAFDARTAGLHSLWWAANLANEVRLAGDPQASVRTRVEAARASWKRVREARVPLDSRSRESHLAAWSAVVN